jgi:zinc protease
MQTRPDQAEQAVQLIHDELQKFVSQGPTETELDTAKNALINGFALRIDSNRKLLDNVASMAWNNLPLNYLDTWAQRVRQVTVGQVVQAFGRVLQPNRLVTVVVGGKP